MKRFQKAYVEISNLCNLRCGFCPSTRRTPGRMHAETFSQVLSELKPYTDFLYFHLMGEPLCHPELERFLEIADENGFRVILTTNGTLLHDRQEGLLRSPALHKVNVSLHAFEANDLAVPFEEYLTRCFAFGKAAEGKKPVIYRLWNRGGADSRNQAILSAMRRAFPGQWVVERRGIRIGNRVYLEYGEKFDWPDLGKDEEDIRFCYGLRDQIGVLWDGTVVPCCLDHEGDISLGNLLETPLEEILASPRARALRDGFSQGQAVEPLCRSCGYAKRFGKD